MRKLKHNVLDSCVLQLEGRISYIIFKYLQNHRQEKKEDEE